LEIVVDGVGGSNFCSCCTHFSKEACLVGQVKDVAFVHNRNAANVALIAVFFRIAFAAFACFLAI